MLQNATPGAAAKEVIITAIDKRAALLEHRDGLGACFRLTDKACLIKAKGERLGRGRAQKYKGELCEAEHTEGEKGDSRIICVCAALTFSDTIKFLKIIVLIFSLQLITILYLFRVYNIVIRYLYNLWSDYTISLGPV